ncbi:MAG: biotin/lipoyl-containing protein, partial [Rhizobiaceae bacterium]
LTRYRPPEETSDDGITIRNDTGVYEGSEISIYYDPMIAKLCTHAPTRIEAIDAMSNALDAFVVDGIGHNIPFLSALMRHQRWRDGNFSTAFIAEEYPDGFHAITPSRDQCCTLAAVALAVELLRKDRLDRFGDRVKPHSGILHKDWVVRVADADVPIQLVSGAIDYTTDVEVVIDNGQPVRIKSDWTAGDTVWRGLVGDLAVTTQVRPILNGVTIGWQGISVKAQAMSPRTAGLYAMMPAKMPPDTSKMLLCPMPGVVVSLHVVEGQEIKAGDILAVVEAMKMENVLRAERDQIVAKVNAKAGDNLAVDAVIMEFSV